MATIARLTVDLIANTSKFTTNIKKARKPIQSLEKTLVKAGLKVNLITAVLQKLGQVALNAARRGIGAVIDQFAQLDKIAKVSSKLGILSENLIALRFAAEQSGVAANTLDMALQRMVRRVNEAAMGTGEAKDALKELRLDAVALSAADPGDAFLQIANAFSQINAQSTKVRLAFKLFDSEGVALLNTLDLGVDKLKAFKDEAKALGFLFSNEDLTRIENVNDSIDKVKKSFSAVAGVIAIEISPFILKVTEQLLEWIKNLRNNDALWESVGKTVRSMVAVIVNGVMGLKFLVHVIRGVSGSIATVLLFPMIKLIGAAQIIITRIANVLGITIPTSIKTAFAVTKNIGEEILSFTTGLASELGPALQGFGARSGKKFLDFIDKTRKGGEEILKTQEKLKIIEAARNKHANFAASLEKKRAKELVKQLETSKRIAAINSARAKELVDRRTKSKQTDQGILQSRLDAPFSGSSAKAITDVEFRVRELNRALRDGDLGKGADAIKRFNTELINLQVGVEDALTGQAKSLLAGIETEAEKLARLTKDVKLLVRNGDLTLDQATRILTSQVGEPEVSQTNTAAAITKGSAEAFSIIARQQNPKSEAIQVKQLAIQKKMLRELMEQDVQAVRF